MQRIGWITILLLLSLVASCGHGDKAGAVRAQTSPPMTGEARVLQSWQGDFPVARLDLLPAGQRENGVGFIGRSDIFVAFWKAFKPADVVPEIDFKQQLVVFARNTRYYNRIKIFKIMVKKGMADVLAMETMSAIPIEEKVALSLVVVARGGLDGIRTGAAIIPID